MRRLLMTLLLLIFGVIQLIAQSPTSPNNSNEHISDSIKAFHKIASEYYNVVGEDSKRQPSTPPNNSNEENSDSTKVSDDIPQSVYHYIVGEDSNQKKAKRYRKNSFLNAIGNATLKFVGSVVESKVSNLTNSNQSTPPTSSEQQSNNSSTPVQMSTPVKNGFTSTKNWSTPVKNGFTPVKDGFTPVKDWSTPVKNGFTPVKDGFTPVKDWSTPVKNGFTPVKDGFTPVKDWSTPVKNGFTPVTNGFTPVKNGFTHVKDDTLSIPVELSKPVALSKEVNIDTPVELSNNISKSKSNVSSKTDAKNIDITHDFDNIISSTKSRFEGLKIKWPFTSEMFEKDINYLISISNQPIDILVTLRYGDLETWRQAKTWITFLIEYFKTNGPGDIKSGLLKEYNSPNTKILYKNRNYTIEELGNINYGIALKAAGLPLFAAQCAAGLYQIYTSLIVQPSSENNRKFINAIIRANRDGAFEGVCFDHYTDSRMIEMGYNWY